MSQASPSRVSFENRITTGNIIALLGPVIVIVGGLMAMKSSLDKHDAEILDLKKRVDATSADHDLLIRIDTKLANVLEQMARMRRAETERNVQ